MPKYEPNMRPKHLLKIFVLVLILLSLYFTTKAQCPRTPNAVGGFIPDKMCAPVHVYLMSTSQNIVTGATFTVDWGDGSAIETWTATANGNYSLPGTNPPFDMAVPSNSRFYHTYATSPANCAYTPKVTITNHCTSELSANLSSQISVWDVDQPGMAVTQPVYYVCEGYGATVQFTDATNFNCLTPPVGAPNTDARTLVWEYGTGATNLLGVTLATLGTPPPSKTGASYTTSSSGTTSQVITVPAAATVGKNGQFFEVRLNNWNACNPYPGSTSSKSTARIEVIQSPPAPTITDKIICAPDVQTLTVTSATTGTVKWYSNSTLTTQVGTGTSYTPSPAVAAGASKSFWVTETLGATGCQGPATKVTLTVRAALGTPTVSGSTTVCENTSGNYTASIATTANTEYNWNTPTSWSGAASTTTTKSYTYGNASGTIQATYQYNAANQITGGGRCGVTGSLAVTVNTLPIAGIYADSASTRELKASYCSSDNVKVRFGGLTKATALSAGTYTINYFDGTNNLSATGVNSGSGSFTPSTQPLANTVTTYTIKSVVKTSVTPNCTSTSALNPTLIGGTCVITKRAALTTPAAITPTATVCSGATGLEYYPNPTSAQFTTPPANGGATQYLWQITTANGWKYSDNTTTDKTDNGDNKMQFTAGTGSGTFQVKLQYQTPITPNTGTNRCPSSARTVTIPVAAIPDGILSASTPVCNGSNPSLTITVSGGLSPYNVYYSATPLATNHFLKSAPSSPYTFAHANTISAATSFRLDSVKSGTAPFCKSIVSNTVNVGLYAIPTASITSLVPTICSGEQAIIQFNLPLIEGPFTVVLRRGASDTTITGLNDGDKYYHRPTAGPTISYKLISVQRTNLPNCPGTVDPTPQIVTVNDPPTKANAGRDTSLCSQTTYTLQGNAPSLGIGGWTCVSTGGNPPPTFSDASNRNSTVTIISGNWGNYIFRWTITNGTCNPSTDDVTIAFGGPPPSPNAGPDATVCYPNYTLNGVAPPYGTGTWTNRVGNPTIATFTDSHNPISNVQVYASGVYYFVWTITNGTCYTARDTVKITFDPLPISNAGTDATICASQTSVNIAGSSANTTFKQWITTLDGNLINGNSNTLTYEPGPVALAAGFVNLVLRVNATGTCLTPAYDTMKLIINKLPTPQASTANLDSVQVCGLSYALSAAASAYTGVWSVTGPGIVTTAATWKNSRTPTITVSKYGQYKFVWTETNGSCTVYDSILVRFCERPTAYAGLPISLCESVPSPSTALSATPYGYSSTGGWFRTTQWSRVSGTDPTPTFSAPTSPTSNVSVTSYGTYVFKYKETNGACADSSNVTVNFNLKPIVSIIPATADTCQGIEYPLNVNIIPGTGATFSHLWTGTTSILSGTTIVNPKVKNTTPAGIYSVTYTATDNKTCTASDSRNITIDTLPSITTQPVNAATCNGNNASFSLSATGTGLNYAWFQKIPSGTITSAGSALPLNITGAGLGMDGNKYWCTVTTSKSCVVTSSVATLTVNAFPNITSQPHDTSVCENGNAQFTVLASGTGLTYRWYRRIGAGPFLPMTDGTLLGVIYAGTSGKTLSISNATIAINSNQFYCDVTATGSCNLHSDTVTLIVNLNPTITTIPDGQPKPLELCEKNPISKSISVNGSATGYQWQKKNEVTLAFDNIIDDAPRITGAGTPSLNFLNTDAGLNNTIYRCKLTTFGGVCALFSNSATLTVTLKPTATAGANDKVCSNTPTYTLQPGVAAANYDSIRWTSGTIGTSFINSRILLPVYNHLGANATLYLTAYGKGTCGDSTSSMNLTVIPAPLVSAGPDGETCQGTGYTLSGGSASNNLGALVWTSTSPWGTFSSNSATPTFTTAASETGAFTLTINADGNPPCASTHDDMTLTITPKPTANAGSDEAICAGLTFNFATSTLAPSASENDSLKWTSSTLRGTWNFDNILTPTFTPDPLDYGTTINLILTAYGKGSCTNATDFMKLTVKALPQLQPIATPPSITPKTSFCTYTSIVYKANLQSGSGSAMTTYKWGVTSPVNVPDTSSFGKTYIAEYNSAYNGKIYVVANDKGCNGDTVFINAKAIDPPVVDAGANTTFCSGSTYEIGGHPAATGGSGSFKYQWAPTTALSNYLVANPIANPTTTIMYTLMVTDLVSGCAPSYDNVTIDVTAIPAPPSVSDKTSCYLSPVPDLEASGSNIKWYAEPGKVTLLGTGATYATGKTLAGTYTYYATQTIGGCESPVVAVNLIINAVPALPTARDTTACSNAVIPPLKATGTDIRWYSDIALTSLVYGDASYNTGKILPGVYNYYATQTVSGCESNAKQVTLTIYAPPVAPTTTDQTACIGGGAIPTLPATGTSIRWYSDVALTTLVGSGNNFNTGKTTAGSYTYYATQTEFGCQSISKSATLIINPSPAITKIDSTPQTTCNSNDATITINATGAAPLAYSIDGGVGYASTNIFINLSQGTYPVRVKNGYGCVTAGRSVTISVGGAPPAPTATSTWLYCSDNTILPITATTSVTGPLKWYSDAGLTTQVQTGASYTPPKVTGTKYYYVTVTKDTCQSAPKVVTVTINATPAAPVALDKSTCVGDSVSLTASGINVVWYTNSDMTTPAPGGTGNSYFPSFNIGSVGDADFFVRQTVSGCSSLGTHVVLHVNGFPPAPASSDATVCAGFPVPSLSVANSEIDTTIKWYNNVALTSLAYSGKTFATGKTVPSTYSYYATQTVKNCRSTGKLVQLTIKPTPATPLANDETACFGSTIPNLTASATGTVRWYSDAALSTLVFTGNPFATGHTAVGTYNYWLTQTIDGCTSAADQATLTIKSKPAPPTALALSACFASAIPDMAATGDPTATFKWYDASFTFKHSGNYYPTGLTASGTYNFNVIQTVNGCESFPTSTSLTINPLPVHTSNAITHETYCGTKDGAIGISATGTGLQYSIDNGTTYSGLNSFPGLNPGTYSVKIKDANGCINTGGAVTINPGGAPPAPTASGGGTYCTPTAPGVLTATGHVPAGTLRWYDGATFLSTGGTLTPFNTVGTKNYAVTEIINGCEGPATVLTVTVNTTPVAPVVTNATMCDYDPAPTFTTTGTNVNWYADAGLTSLLKLNSTSYTPVKSSQSLFVTQTVSGCTSPVTTATLTLYPITPVPLANDTSICFGSAIADVSSTGSTVKWYSNNTLTTLLSSGNKYSTGKTVAGNYTYYVTQTQNGCQSLADMVTLTINPRPDKPVSSSITICADSLPRPPLTATAIGPNTLNWYSDTALTSSLGSATSLVVVVATIDTFYVTQTSPMGCRSLAAVDTYKVVPNPPAPIVINESACFMGTIPNLTATGSNIKWYSGATWVHTGSPFTTGNTAVGTYSYNVTQTVSGCKSAPVIQTLTIYDLPQITSILPTNENFCNTKDGIIDINAVPSLLPLEFSINNGSSYYPGNYFDSLVSGTYTVKVRNVRGCVKSGGSITIAPGTNPPTPVVSPDTSYCSGATINDLFAKGVTGGYIKWFSDAGYTHLLDIDTTVLSTDISKITPSGTVGTKNYYVYDSIGSCTSTPAVVKVTVNALPTAITSGSAEICDDGSMAPVTFTFTGAAPYTFNYLITKGASIIPSASTAGASVETISTSIPGRYTINSLTDNNGCTALPAALTGFADIVVHQLPTVTTSGTAHLCNDGVSAAPILFTITDTTAAPWNFRYTNSITTDTFNVTTAINTIPVSTKDAGKYIGVELVSSKGCRAVDFGDTATIYLHNLPTGTLLGSDTLCKGELHDVNAILTGEGPWNITYSIDGITSVTTPVLASPFAIADSTGGEYKLNYIFDKNGCPAKDLGVTARIKRNPLPNGYISAKPSICIGDSTALKFTLTGKAPYKAVYKLGAASDSITTFNTSDSAYVYPPIGTNLYILKKVVDDNGCITSIADTAIIVVNNLPLIASIILTPGTPSSCAINDGELTVNATPAGGGGSTLSYSIDNKVTYQPFNFFNGLATGTYQIYVKEMPSTCINTGTQDVATGSPPPAPIFGSTNTYCQGETMDDLTVSGTTGTVYLYKSSMTNPIFASGNIFPFVKKPDSDLGATTYYAKEVYGVGPDCVSLTSKVTITIKSKPAKPKATDTTTCAPYTASKNPFLMATGSKVSWYQDDLTNLVKTNSNTYKPFEIDPGTYRFLATQTVNGCESQPDTAIFKLNPLPSEPLVHDVDVCSGAAVPDMHADTTSIKWYNDAQLKNYLASGNNYPTGKLSGGPYRYFATQTKNGCESPYTAATLTIKAKPALPKAKDVTYACEGSAIPDLIATSAIDAIWYASDGTTVLSTGNVFDHPGVDEYSSPGTFTYYVTQTIDGCESDKKMVLLIIKPTPPAPILTSPEYCKGAGTPLLTASSTTAGATIAWYAGSSSTALQSNTSLTYLSGATAPNTYNYSAKQILDGCSSPRTYTTIKINPVPNIVLPIVTVDESYCNRADGSIDINATDPSLMTYAIDSNMVTAQGLPSFKNLKAGFYQVVVENPQGCRTFGPLTQIKAGGPPPPPMAGTDTSYCNGSPLVAISATATLGGTLKWYNDVGLAAASLRTTGVASTLSTTPDNTLGTKEYFATETYGGCQSLATKITITINPVPPAATATNVVVCEGSAIPSLTASGTNTINWYSAAAPTTLLYQGPTYVTGMSAVGIYPYKVRQVTDKNCLGTAIDVSLSINGIPLPVEEKVYERCSGTSIPPLSVTGSNIRWYDDAGKVVLLSTDNPFNTGETTVQTKLYYATQTVSGCESPVATQRLVIKATPTPPLTVDKTMCSSLSVVTPLNADGENIKWYNASRVEVGSGTNYTPSVAITPAVHTYYAKQTVEGCTSDSTPAKLTIIAEPSMPIARDTAICVNQPTPDLVATGTDIKWYQDANLNIKLHDGSSYATGKNAKGTYSYYVAQNIGGCQSKAVKVILAINAIPRFLSAPQTNETYCDTKDGSISINAIGTGTIEYSIDDGATYTSASSKFTNLSKGVYPTAIRNGAGCEVKGDVINIKAGGPPPAPNAGPDAEYCEGDNINDIKASPLVGTIKWYRYPDHSSVYGNTNDVTPLTTHGNYTYYATESIHGCESPHTEVKIIISPRPAIPIAANQTVCANQIIPDLTADGSNIIWYSAANVIAYIGRTFTTGQVSSGTYSYDVTQTVNYCESQPQTVTLTIHPVPDLDVVVPKLEGCPPLALDFTANQTGADTVKWYIDNNQVKSSTSDFNFSKTFYDSTIYTKFYKIKTIAKTQYNCQSDFINDIKVYPMADFSFTVAPDSMCSKAHMQFVSKRGGKLYNWQLEKNEVTPSSSSSISHTYQYDPLNDTTINVRLIATSLEYNCTDTSDHQIVIFPSAKVGFTIDKDAVCTPDSIRITNTSKNATKSYWKFNDGSPDITTNTVVPFYHAYTDKRILTFSSLDLSIETNHGCSATTSKNISVKPEVKPNFAVDTMGCSPHEAQFTNLTDVDPSNKLTYSWNFNEGTPSDLANPFHSFYNPDTSTKLFRVILTTISKDNCVDTVSRVVYVLPILQAGFELDTDHICQPLAMQITNTSNGACNGCYSWDFGDNTISHSGDSLITHSYPVTDTRNSYYTKLMVWSQNNKCIDSVKRMIIVNPPLTANFNIDSTACSPYSTTFEDISTGAGTRYYSWNFGDGITSSMITPAHSFVNNADTATTYRVRLSTRSEFGCFDDTMHTITLYPAPEAGFKISPYMQFFPGATFTFKDRTSKGPWNYLWNFGDGRDTTIAGDVEHTYLHWGEKAKDYKLPVSLIASNVNCADTAYDTLLLFAPRPIAKFDTISNGCTPVTLDLTNQSIWGESYVWDFDDEDTAQSENATHTFKEPRDYNIKLTVTAEGGTDTYSRILKVYPIPVADFEVEPTELMLPKRTIKCYNLTEGGFTYLWDFGDGTSSVESDPKHMYPEDKDKMYTLSLIAYSKYNCSDTIAKDSIVTIKAGGQVKYPTAFVPDFGGPNGGNLAAGANPNSVFRPFVESVKEYHFEIFNRWGERVFASDNIDIGWDGYYKGKMCAQDVYVYKAWGKFHSGQTFVKAGDITLLHKNKK
jgi:hypothetical protein